MGRLCQILNKTYLDIILLSEPYLKKKELYFYHIYIDTNNNNFNIYMAFGAFFVNRDNPVYHRF